MVPYKVEWDDAGAPTHPIQMISSTLNLTTYPFESGVLGHGNISNMLDRRHQGNRIEEHCFSVFLLIVLDLRPQLHCFGSLLTLSSNPLSMQTTEDTSCTAVHVRCYMVNPSGPKLTIFQRTQGYDWYYFNNNYIENDKEQTCSTCCYIRFALTANRCNLNNKVLISRGLRGTTRKHWQFHSKASWWEEAYWIYTVNSLKPNGLNETLDISPFFLSIKNVDLYSVLILSLCTYRRYMSLKSHH